MYSECQCGVEIKKWENALWFYDKPKQKVLPPDYSPLKSKSPFLSTEELKTPETLEKIPQELTTSNTKINRTVRGFDTIKTKGGNYKAVPKENEIEVPNSAIQSKYKEGTMGIKVKDKYQDGTKEVKSKVKSKGSTMAQDERKNETAEPSVVKNKIPLSALESKKDKKYATGAKGIKTKKMC